MSDFLLQKAKACAFTGHRILEKGFSEKNLRFVLEHLIQAGYSQFLVGMALGFDTVCFKVLEEYRKKTNLKIIACIPCETQSEKFTIKQKAEYDRMLSVADMTIFVSKQYNSYCMQKRNRFMVDNASCLIAHIVRDYGGTAKTVEYAEQKGVKVYYV